MSIEKLTIAASDGTDVTEAVQILYDIAHSSMDWGSGFLDNAEMEAVIAFAVHMGWQVPDLPDNSEPMITVARKFPDHYEVSYTDHPRTTAISGYVFEPYRRWHIRVKGVGSR